MNGKTKGDACPFGHETCVLVMAKNERIASLVRTIVDSYEEANRIEELTAERNSILQTFQVALTFWRELAERAGGEEMDRWHVVADRIAALIAGDEEEAKS